MRARMIGLLTVAAVVTPALVEGPSIAAATTAQVYVTGYVDRGYTASGVYTHPGTCAVDPRVIPLGTYITIDGLGTCHAEDTGSAVIGYHVDIWVPTTAQAYAITGWRSATWSAGPSQQVLAYHAAAPTPTSTSAPLPSATATLVPPSPTAAPPTLAPPTATTTASGATPTGVSDTSAYTTPAPLATTTVTVPPRPSRGYRTRLRTAQPTPTQAAPDQSTPAQVTPTPAIAAATASAPALRPHAAAAPRKPRCHTVYWTTHVHGYRYTHWRTTCP